MPERIPLTDRQDNKEEIPLADGLHLTATRFGDWSNPLVIFAHGQGGSEYSPLMYHATRLNLPNFSTLALNFYDKSPNTRDFKETTVQQQANDFDAVVAFAREKGTPHIQAVGHSLGGLAILRSTAQINGAVLWDPSHFGAKYGLDERDIRNLPNENLSDGGVFFTSGLGYLLPHTLQEEAGENRCLNEVELVQKRYPMLFITGERSPLRPFMRDYSHAASGYSEFKIIPGASHSFLDSDQIRDELFSYTCNWLNFVLAYSENK